MTNNLVLSFNETTWEFRLLEKDSDYKLYSVFLDGKSYKKINLRLSTHPVDDYNVFTVVKIYKNDEYLGSMDYKGSNVDLDVMIDIITWIKLYTRK